MVHERGCGAEVEYLPVLSEVEDFVCKTIVVNLCHAIGVESIPV